MSQVPFGIDVLLQFFVAFEGVAFWKKKELEISKRFSFVGQSRWENEWSELRKKEHVSLKEIIWRIVKLIPGALKNIFFSIPRYIYMTLCYCDDVFAKTPPFSFTFAIVIIFIWGRTLFFKYSDFFSNKLPYILLYFVLAKVLIKILTLISNKIALKLGKAPNPKPLDLEDK